ncbi:MAG: serine/threonine-protein kinase [Verrucomicrobiota bacterium]
MNAPTQFRCPQCAQPISQGVKGLCPNCLALVAFGPDESSTQTVVSATSPSDAEAGLVAAPKLEPRPLLSGNARYFGDYELLEEIARGGMGVVFKARQKSLNRLVAVKMILGGQLATESDVKRFHTEAEAAANLQHPNIVAIHEVGEHEGRHYFSMEYVAGKNLAQWIDHKPMLPASIAPLLRKLAWAVHYAHQRGTLHRDLKPHNVLVDEQGEPHITDFGLAKRVKEASDLTQTGAIMGSPSYMSPEQALGQQSEVGPASDVYSLGAMLYEMLTGQPPFRGTTPLETLRAVLEQEPVAPSKRNSKVPGDLETICLKCLDKKPERRYASARALAEDLERFLRHEPIVARPAGLLHKIWTWMRQHPWALTGAASLLVLGLTGLAYGLWEQNRALSWAMANGRPATMEKSWPFAWSNWNLAILMNGVFFAPFVFADFVDRKRRHLKFATAHLTAYSSIGVLEIFLGLLLTVRTVKHFVWGAIQMDFEARTIGAAAIWIVGPCWFGALLLWHAVLEARRARYGEMRSDEGELFPPAHSKTTVEQHQLANAIFIVALGLGFLDWIVGRSSPAGHFHGSLQWALTATCSLTAVACFFAYRTSKEAFRHVGLFFGGLATVGVAVISQQAFADDWASGGQSGYAAWAQPLAVLAGVISGWWLMSSNRRRTGKTLTIAAEKLWPRLDEKRLGWFVYFIALAPLIYGLLRADRGSEVNGFVNPFYGILAGWLCSFLPVQWLCWRAAAGAERRARGHTLIIECITLGLLAFNHPSRLIEVLGSMLAWLAVGILIVAAMFFVDRRLGRMTNRAVSV